MPQSNHYSHQSRSHNDRRRQQPAEKVQSTVTIGQRFPLTIRRLGINGEGIGYYKHVITFVKGALPEEVVVAEVTAVHPRYLEAKIRSIRKPSPDRVDPQDVYAGEVGGFELEHLDYPAQLTFKQDLIRQALEKYRPAGYRHYDVRPTIGMADPYAYRNKAQFQVRMIDGHVAAGLYKENSHDLVDLPTCSVQMPATMTVMRQVVAWLEELEVPIYDETHNSGIVKTLVVREAAATGEVQLVFITNTPKLPKKHQLLMKIAEKLPMVVSVMQNVNAGKTSLIWGDQTTLLAGKPTITEELDGLVFDLSARAFFQLNPQQTKKLYRLAREALDLAPNETLVDAYSGVGTIGLSLADVAKEVRGMDTIPAAVADANANAKRNQITNAHYEVGEAEVLLPQWLASGFTPDAMVVDPPRTGLDGVLIDAILQSAPEKLVYISCNPSTLARDLQELTRGYQVDYIQSIDMFPQTARCEAVVRFTKRH
ncbi:MULTISPECIES: 23S rRNA (uracil(1939)-C(5))-methyltransferase RlmD [Lactiplantibacillus]|uniref:23S rRNA (Uracil(1939)-C(5))-methyltransferase RlmD n=1 Tax=Lactiplantibacillus pentosus TaxID=1589 RepID=A0ABD7INE5_LACPE|nr:MULTISPECIES: 23S rRNA (uracil(1939)-C(5))-methyltransferase RlmD [Lactiplantibacillus]MBU7447579.1 23S rRNA (uracil(1939)-C(5))-methyltransferase RlmD [Lactiplantibacillus sp. 7.2.4]MBU7480721.1 23S rRNA (uracil(1939)-C(5))-methyltransferase RlmD [Lactiplantibacillus pentosus]MBU7504232.1 23S rRNA (uracil(1939)-C(5))-methyltransferase RlmD [Lactiplantibacillus pentosus]MCC3163661.1 23S rRNA (uracil(1939)-C(5))-methyltransferase RlmD [Lactiplantibacillus pentosus]MCJ8188682.1 23S rRNA (urac